MYACEPSETEMYFFFHKWTSTLISWRGASLICSVKVSIVGVYMCVGRDTSLCGCCCIMSVFEHVSLEWVLNLASDCKEDEQLAPMGQGQESWSETISRWTSACRMEESSWSWSPLDLVIFLFFFCKNLNTSHFFLKSLHPILWTQNLVFRETILLSLAAPLRDDIHVSWPIIVNSSFNQFYSVC